MLKSWTLQGGGVELGCGETQPQSQEMAGMILEG